MITRINQDAMIFRLLPERRAWKEINYENLKWNVQLLQSLLPAGCGFMAVVKANAYGHGAVPVSSYLNRLGISSFAVATVREGIELREAGIRGEILILGYTPPREVNLITSYDLIQTVVDCAHAQALSHAALCPVKVHLKLDTGMHRLGERCEHIEEIARLFSLPRLRIEGVFSHLCAADSAKPEDIRFTQEQMRLFADAVAQLKAKGLHTGKVHLHSSYGILHFPKHLSAAYGNPPPGSPKSASPEPAVSCARFGIAMYGALSSPDPELLREIPLRPVLSLHSQVALVKELHTGESVSYGRNFTADRPMRIAAVTIGYADGLPRSLSGKNLPVLVRGRRASVIGNICMDQLLIDVTEIPQVRPGDTVTLLGTDGPHTLRPEEMAEKAGTITNELFTRLRPRG